MSRQQVINYGITDASVSSSKIAGQLPTPLSVGQAPQSNVMFAVSGAVTSGIATQGAFEVNPVFPATTTTRALLFEGGIVTAAASFTVPDARVFSALAPTLGAGSAITNMMALYVGNMGAAGVANAYGVYVAPQSGASGANIGIYNGGSMQVQGAIGMGQGPMAWWGLYVGGTYTNNSGGPGELGGIAIGGTLATNYNNDVIAALYISPTFQDNGHTGVAHYAIHSPSTAPSVFAGPITINNTLSVNGTLQGITGGPYTTDWFRCSTSGQGLYNSAQGVGISFDSTGPTVYGGSGGKLISTTMTGLVSTAMIAANAAQQFLSGYQGTPGFSTTTTGQWLQTAMVFSFTSTGGTLRIELNATAAHSVAGGAWYVGIGCDSVSPSIYIYGSTQLANNWSPISLVFYWAPGAGSHTVYGVVYNASAGTFTLASVGYASLWVTEQKR